MDEVVLKWSILPACIFEHLTKFKGESSYYGPVFGAGVYLFIFPTKKGYQIYYIGESTEVGSRLLTHFNDYTHARNDYYMPIDIALFEEDIYKIFSSANNKYMQQASDEFPTDERRLIGKKLMHNTYFAFSQTQTDDKSKLRAVEALLQIGLLKKNCITKQGWFGERTSIMPDYDLEVANKYTTAIVEQLMKPTMPAIIKCQKGSVSII